MAKRGHAAGPMSTTSWSKTAGGIGSMRREIRCWKGLRRKRERRGKACGLIRIRQHRGSGDGVQDVQLLDEDGVLLEASQSSCS